MRRLTRLTLSAAGLLLFATSSAFAAQPVPLDPAGNDNDLVPTGKGWGERQDTAPPRVNPNGKAPPGGGGGGSGNGIFYHGGPVMRGTTHAYYIWYGNWSGNNATTILTDLMNNMGGSPYFNINTTYYDGAGPVVNSVALAGTTSDSYSQGSALSDTAIKNVVSSAITSGRLPKDTNGVYFVLTSADVNATSGFCTQYCGWHTHGTISGSDIKYSFVGNPERCPNSCAWDTTTSPNGNIGADGMASIIAHELEEAVTDPDLNAWYDRRGYENADKCAWTFGNTYTANGGLANMKLGSRDFLIQRNWVNAAGGYCAQAY